MMGSNGLPRYEAIPGNYTSEKYLEVLSKLFKKVMGEQKDEKKVIVVNKAIGYRAMELIEKFRIDNGFACIMLP